MPTCANGCGKPANNRFCSMKCASQYRWKNKGKAIIPKYDVIKRVVHEGENEGDVAASYNTSLSTIYRIMKDAGVRGRSGLQKRRPIYVPRDKTVFVVSADPLRAGEIELTMKKILRDQQILTNKYVVQVYEPNFTTRDAARQLHLMHVGSNRRYSMVAAGSHSALLPRAMT